MPKRNEYPAEGSCTLPGIQRLRRRALKAFAACEDFRVPQLQRIDLVGKGGLPGLGDLSGVALDGFRAEGYFSTAEQAQEKLADILRRGRAAMPKVILSIACHVGDAGKLEVQLWERKTEFVAWVPGWLKD